MDKFNDLTTWLLQFSNTSPASSTHFSLVGGKWEIPPKHHNEFLRLYATVLQKTEYPHAPVVFFVEKKTPIFRMHFDLDIVQATAASATQLLDWTRLFTSTCKTYYPDLNASATASESDNTFVCYISKAATTKRVKGWTRDVVDSIKTGVHLIWPFLLVDQIQALYLREACIAAAKLQWGERTAPANPWADMIDESVLLKNGLRMVGSDKSQPCKTCSGDKKLMAVCTNQACKSGKVRENRPYLPYRVLNGQLEEDFKRLSEVVDEEDCLKRVELFTTRSLAVNPTPGYVVPEIAAIPSSLPRVRKVKELLTSDDRENPRERAATQRALTENNGFLVSSSDMLFRMVEDYFKSEAFQRDAGGVQWAHLELKKLVVFPDNSRYLVKVGGLGAHFCLNVGRQHGSSTIYFMIDSFGMRQRCYSTKQCVGAVTCKKFAGPRFLLPKVLSMSLFASQPDFSQLRAPNCLGAGQAATTVTPTITTELTTIGFDRCAVESDAPTQATPPVLIPITPVVVTPITGYVDERKQMVAVEAVRKLNFSANKRKSDLIALATSCKRGELPTHAPVAHAPKRPNFTCGDFTTKEINAMNCIDLINRDRQELERAMETAKQVQDESFKMLSKPALQPKVRRPPGSKRVKKTDLKV